MSNEVNHEKAVHAALDQFRIELPSWGFADTGTRFGKFPQAAAASTPQEKFHDAGLVHQLTGCCPSVAVHVLWDFDLSLPSDEAGKQAHQLAAANGIRIGSVNPNLFQDAVYKLGSFCSPSAEARQAAMAHAAYCVQLMPHAGSRVLSLWLADGTNYPGQDDIRGRKRRLESALSDLAALMRRGTSDGLLLVEYKPFEPAFYHTDVADWGMAAAFCRAAGENAKVLVDTGHHLPGQNVEHIVAFLLDEGLLGGFHFNDRKYADDDLTLGSIDPYAAFRIFDQIHDYAFDHGGVLPSIEYMVDQSHNLKPKLEAMVQTVCEAQKLFARAATVDRKRLREAQAGGDIVAAESCLKEAFDRDVSGLVASWRKSRNLADDPLHALRGSGVIERLGNEREAARKERGAVATSAFA